MKKINLITCAIIFIVFIVTLYVAKNKSIENRGEKIYMEYEFDSMIGIEGLDLYYEAHLAGLDGECFIYNVYSKDKINSEIVEEIKKSIEDFSKTYDNNGDTYPGYIDIQQLEGKVTILNNEMKIKYEE